MNPNKSFNLLLTLLAVALASGCASDNGGRVLESDGVRTLVSAPKDGGRDAQIAGQLKLTEGRCLAVESDDGRVHMLVWPSGVTLLTDGQVGVNVPGLGPITVGESFAGSGGYSAPPLGEKEPDIPDECSIGDAEVAIIDQAESIRKS
ncbi:MAG TPA: hypothetical protein VFX60_06680 [Micromonospora sp.]|nr:hypothetical protein [Micromonospora sp.]